MVCAGFSGDFINMTIYRNKVHQLSTCAELSIYYSNYYYNDRCTVYAGRHCVKTHNKHTSNNTVNNITAYYNWNACPAGGGSTPPNHFDLKNPMISLVAPLMTACCTCGFWAADIIACCTLGSCAAAFITDPVNDCCDCDDDPPRLNTQTSPFKSSV